MKNRTKKMENESGSIDIFNVKYHKMFGISFFGSNLTTLLMKVEKVVKESKEKMWITTVNTEFVMTAVKNKEFMDIINKSDLKIIDGVGLIWAQKVLEEKRGIKRCLIGLKIGGEILRGKHRDSLIPGSDLVDKFSRLTAREKYKIFYLGGWGNRAEKTAKYFKSQLSDLRCQWSQGEPEVKNEEVLKEINNFKPDILLVAYGMKKQEEWIEKNLSILKVKVVMGVGRSFDYYSGDLKRAPKGVRTMGMEWLYSLIKEPKRWKRQLELPKFIWMVLTKIA